MSKWSHLANAKHIDRIIAEVKANPSGLPVQNVDVKEAGAAAYAKVLCDELGIKAYPESKLD